MVAKLAGSHRGHCQVTSLQTDYFSGFNSRVCSEVRKYVQGKKHEMIVIFVNDLAVMCKMCPSYFLLYYFYESFFPLDRAEVSFCE